MPPTPNASILTTVMRSPDLRALAKPLYGPVEGRLRLEVIVMRLFGAAWLVGVMIEVLRGSPRPGLHGRGAIVLVALVALYAFAVWSESGYAASSCWMSTSALEVSPSSSAARA